MGRGWGARLWLCLCLLSWIGLCRPLQLDELFGFGAAAGDARLPPGSDSTAELHLNHPVMFFRKSHRTVYINTNGFVAFAQPPDEQQYLGKMPSDFTMIAALMGDLDNGDGQGNVYFREDSSLHARKRAAEHIRKAFPRDDEVEPTTTFIVTWENIAAHGTSGLAAERNTFQLVVASLELSSFAILLYPNDGLQFFSTLVGHKDTLLEGGFNEGLVSGWLWQQQGTFFRTTTDEENSLSELVRKTNSAKNGVWVYEIGSSPFFIGITSGMVFSSPEDEEATEPPQTMLPRQTEGLQNLHSSTMGTPTNFTEAVANYKEEAPTETPHGHQTNFPETAIITPDYSDMEDEMLDRIGEHPTSNILISTPTGSEKVLQRFPDEPDSRHPQPLKPNDNNRADATDTIAEPFHPRSTSPEPSKSKSSFGPSYLNPDLIQPRNTDAKSVQPDPQYTRPSHSQIVVVDEDDELDVNVFSYNLETCAQKRITCSAFADCRDYSNGYCCHCRPGFYGNGEECVAEGKPQRMNGKVNGRIFVGSSPFAVELNNNDLHAYVVANDGRAYVAISNIANSVGPSLLPLSSLFGVIGWAFALEQPGYQNGFSLIGGVFFQQAEVIFQPGNERLTIKQQFKGIDEHDHLVVNTELEGHLPAIPLGSSVQINSYDEIYHYGTKLINSSCSHNYTIASPDGKIVTNSYQWHQTIVFQGCPHDPITMVAPSIQRLSVDQIFVMFDAGNNLIRYATSNKIGSIHSLPEPNPCFTGQHDCDINAVCRPGEGHLFTCECTAGFSGDGVYCQDIDECQDANQVCGENAVCTNHLGTFRCECYSGFVLARDGKTCIERDGPVDHCQRGSHNCDVPERAVCLYTGGSSYICSCLRGFVSDGLLCRDVDECQQDHCHQEAFCSNTQGSFTCECRPGFEGNGFHCRPLSTEREKTLCEQQKESAQAGASSSQTYFLFFHPRPAVGQYIPQCDERGAFEPTQCHHGIGKCWCVDASGHEIPNTRAGAGSNPMCIDQTVTPPPVGPAPRPDVHPVAPGTHLLFAQSGKIELVSLDGNGMTKEAKPLLHIPDRVVIAVAFDCLENMVYWTDITGPAISKASLTGGSIIPVITNELQSPEGITIDHVARLLFWTDSMRDTVEVSKLDGSQRRVLFDTDLVNPRPIVADPSYGRLYWADWDREKPKIEMSNMDGTDRSILVQDDLGLPNGLTLDPDSQELCWADAGTRKVECMNPHHGERKTVAEGIQYPFALVSVGGSLYYTDWNREAVVTVERHSGRQTGEFLPQKRSRLYGITATKTQCPQAYDYCFSNGGCSHLCLPRLRGFSCRCPDALSTHCVESS